jgi:hypothetical protein
VTVARAEISIVTAGDCTDDNNMRFFGLIWIDEGNRFIDDTDPI